ncbi:speckle targeted PIP5K1A-regulated poly(A) polymerase, partial [Aplysia californica]|uniref:Speckle targeted PIP5K1A-regulated poly(A) polymerase n=1 Tax=Aplysia californica TaxID=6500 RepID=A0ABM0JRF0_APLCA
MEKYCQYCDVKLHAGDFETHCKGKRHRTNMNAKVSRMKLEEAASRRVFIQNVQGVKEPGRLEKLTEYFSRFGKIKFIRFATVGAFVEFRDASSPGKVLSCREHVCRGVRLSVKEYTLRPDRQTVKQEKEQKEQEEKLRSQTHIMGLLMSARDVEDQMSRLSQQLRLTAKDEAERAGICADLTAIFSPFFDSCQIYQFGSSLNGFGLQGCDLDLFIELNQGDASTSSVRKRPIPLPYHRDLKSLCQFSHGPLSTQLLDQVDSLDLVKLLSRILSSHKSDYSEVLTIPSSRCPVIRFSHNPSGIKCDLSFSNRVALLNSRLLRLYSQEPRVHALVTTVRLWAQRQNLAATAQFGHLLTSYSLTWLVLFFVQSQEPALLPSVEQVPDRVPGAETVSVSDFSCVSVPVHAHLPASTNTTSSVELLKGFFEFYTSKVKLSSDILVTRDVETLTAAQFTEKPFSQECGTSFLTVVDPFVLSHNVTKNVNERTRERLIWQIHRARDLLTQSPGAGVDDRSKPWGLAELLTPQAEPAPATNGASTSSKKKKNRALLEVKKAQLFSVQVAADASMLNDLALRAMAQKKNVPLARLWCELARDMVAKVLAQIFLVRVESVSEVEAGGGAEERSDVPGLMGNCAVGGTAGGRGVVGTVGSGGAE